MPSKHKNPQLFIRTTAEDKLVTEQEARDMGMPTSGYLRYLIKLGKAEHDRRVALAKRATDEDQA